LKNTNDKEKYIELRDANNNFYHAYKMSIRPTRPAPPFYSAEEWTRYAIGADKIVGSEGFKNFSSGNWYHPFNYRHINREYPNCSPAIAIEEMAEMRETLVDNIIRSARKLDEMIKRLAKMEKEMKEVMDQL
jgi:hypothetical protein